MSFQVAKTEAISGLRLTAIVTAADYQSARWSLHGPTFPTINSNSKRKARRQCIDHQVMQPENL